MSQSSPIWTKEDLALCREMILRSATNDQCAEKLNRTPGAIARKRIQLVGPMIVRETSVRLASGGIRDVVMDNRLHLIDLMRSYDATTLGEAKAKYRAANEHDIAEAYSYRVVTPWYGNRSMVGSHFADLPT